MGTGGPWVRLCRKPASGCPPLTTRAPPRVGDAAPAAVRRSASAWRLPSHEAGASRAGRLPLIFLPAAPGWPGTDAHTPRSLLGSEAPRELANGAFIIVSHLARV